MVKINKIHNLLVILGDELQLVVSKVLEVTRQALWVMTFLSIDFLSSIWHLQGTVHVHSSPIRFMRIILNYVENLLMAKIPLKRYWWKIENEEYIKSMIK